MTPLTPSAPDRTGRLRGLLRAVTPQYFGTAAFRRPGGPPLDAGVPPAPRAAPAN